MRRTANRLSLILLLTLLAASIPSRVSAEDVWLWPIAGLQAGEGVIAKPGDRIGRERIRGSLFIAAPEGTPVVCPADALVKSSLLGYRKSLHFSNAWGFDKPFDEAVADAAAEEKKRMIDPRYICADILLAVDSREIFIGGLRCDTAFAPGTMLHRGDTLGTVAYAYHRLAQPCIVFSSSWYSHSYDPMTPFGIESTFVRPHIWRTGERRAAIIGVAVLAALVIWLVFHIIYKVKDRRRRAYFQALMEACPSDQSLQHPRPAPIEAEDSGAQPFRQRIEVAKQAFDATPSALVLMAAATDKERTLTADERKGLLDDVSSTFADIMIDVKRSSLKVNTQDLLLCMLSVIHVPTAVMADCLNVGESTIRTRKTRLKNKMPDELFAMFFSAL